jgi:hypothetical protein
MNPPKCVSNYERGDLQCDGDTAGATELERAPCSWRERCAAFSLYLDEDDVELSVHLDGDGAPKAENFPEFCDLLVARFQVSELFAGAVPEVKPIEAEPAKKAPAPKGTSSAWARARQEEVRDLADHFEAELLGALEGIEFAGAGQAAVPGQIYRVDRGRYRSYYVKTANGFDEPVASVHARTRAGAIKVRLPIERDLVENVKRPSPFWTKPIVDGRFLTELLVQDYDKATEASKFITELIRGGRLVSSVGDLGVPPPPNAGGEGGVEG